MDKGKGVARRGRPRRVIFPENLGPSTPNVNEDPLAQRGQNEPDPHPQNEPDPRPCARPRHRNPPQNEPVAEQLLTVLREVLNRDRPQEPPRPRTEEESEDRTITRFLRFNPPSFDGEPDDRKAESWLSAVEKIFRVSNYSDVQKIDYAVYLLEGAALHWWEIVERKWERDGIEKSWGQFRKEFLKKFIPQVVRDARERDFMRLIQGSLSVAKYEAEFNRLIQYAPHVLMDEERRRKKFVEGLRPELRKAVATNRPQDYDSAVEAAMELEMEFQEIHKITEKRKGKWNGNPDSGKGKKGYFKKKPKTGNTFATADKGKAPAGQGKVNCNYCGGTSHMESECWRKLGKCYACGSDQHAIKDCPKGRKNGNTGTQNQQQSTSGRPQIKARAYALTGEESADPTQVVEGKISIRNFICKALFDPGATHSFISHDCAEKLKLPSEIMNTTYEVHTPVRECYETRIRYPQCPIVIENQDFSADLIELPIRDFDLILGMD